jgi:hypothetical protein
LAAAAPPPLLLPPPMMVVVMLMSLPLRSPARAEAAWMGGDPQVRVCLQQPATR